MMRSLRQVRRCIQQHAGADNASPKPTASSPHKCRLTHGSPELGTVISQSLRQTIAPGTCGGRAGSRTRPGLGEQDGPGRGASQLRSIPGAAPLSPPSRRCPEKDNYGCASDRNTRGGAHLCAHGPRDGVGAGDIWNVIGAKKTDRPLSGILESQGVLTHGACQGGVQAPLASSLRKTLRIPHSWSSDMNRLMNLSNCGTVNFAYANLGV
jgi:hypothetical protein